MRLAKPFEQIQNSILIVKDFQFMYKKRVIFLPGKVDYLNKVEYLCIQALFIIYQGINFKLNICLNSKIITGRNKPNKFCLQATIPINLKMP